MSGIQSAIVRSLALVVLLASVTFVQAQESAAVYTVNIHGGACASLGEVTAPLGELTLLPDGQTGQGTASPATSSYAAVPLTLDVLLAEDHAVAVHDAVTSAMVACGEIGGAADTGAAIVIGLRPSGDSGLSGIAYLAPSATETGVSVFLADTGVSTTSGEPEQESQDVATYVPMVRNQVTLLVSSLQRVDALFDTPQPMESAWGEQLVAELTLWQILYEDAQELRPPAELADFHTRYLDAVSLLDSAATDILAALENGDQALLAQAGEKIDQGVAAIRALDTPPATPVP